MNAMAQVRKNTDLVKKLAADFGFDQVGITAPHALTEGEEAVAEWVKEGRHGNMQYLELLQKRKETFMRDFPDPKSVIVLGVNYYSRSAPSAPSGKLSGRVARYAWGADYHEVIRRKHHELIERLKNELGEEFSAKSCVDVQPIPERFAAVKAGLGFIGKHTGILNERFGPWLFLSEILTNLDLDPEIPSQGDCGTCDHCQSACPTGALDKDYNIDARLCIAYLTIEHKGVIPRALRAKMKDWIFGCDDCLNVCPFTSKSQETSWKELRSESGVGINLKIEELFSIKSNSQFRARFKESALSRVSRKQLIRNACVVLGNSGSREAIPFLKLAMEDSSTLVRIHGAWALGELNIKDARAILRARERIEDDPEVLGEIRHGLGKSCDKAEGLPGARISPSRH